MRNRRQDARIQKRMMAELAYSDEYDPMCIENIEQRPNTAFGSDDRLNEFLMRYISFVNNVNKVSTEPGDNPNTTAEENAASYFAPVSDCVIL